MQFARQTIAFFKNGGAARMFIQARIVNCQRRVRRTEGCAGSCVRPTGNAMTRAGRPR